MPRTEKRWPEVVSFRVTEKTKNKLVKRSEKEKQLISELMRSFLEGIL